MKKSIFLLVLFSLLASMSVIAAAEDPTANAPKATTKPVIDGKIDAIWASDDRMYGTVYGDTAEGLENPYIVNSYASLCWDEDGLYLLGVMYDKTIPENDTEARNSIDFWVSETCSDESAYLEDGDWHYCKASDGTEKYYTGNESVYDEAVTAVKVYDDFYVVEIFCPWQTEGFSPAVGDQIGFTVSFNDDIDMDGTRDMYSYWATTEASGAYWEQTMALPRITLVEGPAVEAPEEPAVEPDEIAEAPADSTGAAESTPVTADAGVVAAAAMMAAAAGVILSKKN